MKMVSIFALAALFAIGLNAHARDKSPTNKAFQLKRYECDVMVATPGNPEGRVDNPYGKQVALIVDVVAGDKPSAVAATLNQAETIQFDQNVWGYTVKSDHRKIIELQCAEKSTLDSVLSSILF